MWFILFSSGKSAASGVTFKRKDGKPNVTLRSAAEVDAYFNENKLGIDILCPYVATYNITYSTTSANGELIQASARVLVNYGEMTFPWDYRMPCVSVCGSAGYFFLQSGRIFLIFPIYYFYFRVFLDKSLFIRGNI